MASLTIRDLDDDVKLRLRVLAASRNRSMEEEARQILRAALQAEPAVGAGGLATRIRARMKDVGFIDLPIPPRGPERPLPDFAGTEVPPKARAKPLAAQRRTKVPSR